MRTIIGIDPGLAATGYGIIKTGNNKQRHIVHGTIRTGPEEDLEKRLLTIYRELTEILEHYKPTEAGVETIYFAKNIKTAIPVAHARGAILVALAAGGVLLKEYTPLQIKQAVVGRGRAEKSQVQQMVRYLLALEKIPSPDHAADALAVAVCHSHQAEFDRLVQKGR
jgi:crossover junction endodeoxyribonuclease RuvC